SEPVAVSGGEMFTAISSGFLHTCGVTTDGRVLCWGGNADGQLGTGSNDDSGVPAQVSAAASFVALSAGDFHTCALSSDAATWCWGWNAAGQLGIGTTISTSAPTAVGG